MWFKRVFLNYFSSLGYPQPKYEWRKIDSNEVLPFQGETLTISPARLSDNGQYACTPYNVMGQGGTSTIIVEIHGTIAGLDNEKIVDVVNVKLLKIFRLFFIVWETFFIFWWIKLQKLHSLIELILSTWMWGIFYQYGLSMDLFLRASSIHGVSPYQPDYILRPVFLFSPL